MCPQLERLVGVFAYRINHCCENHMGHTNTPCWKCWVFVVKPGRIYWPQGSKRLSMSPGSTLAELLLFVTEDFCGYLESLHVKTGIDWHILKETPQPTSQSIRNYHVWLCFYIITHTHTHTHTHTYTHTRARTHTRTRTRARTHTHTHTHIYSNLSRLSPIFS